MRKIKVRHVKFSPEEMAYDAPAEIDFGKGPVFRGVKEWERFLSFKRGYVKLDSELRGKFANDDEIREALRKYVEIREMVGRKRRKTA